MNKVRANPSSLVPTLTEMLQYFNGNLYSEPDKTPLETNEGAAAVNEAISFL